MNREMRTLESKFQTREENEEKRIEGYFSLFDVDSHANTLSGDIRPLINHDTTLVLGTVDMRTDAQGLWLHFKNRVQ